MTTPQDAKKSKSNAPDPREGPPQHGNTYTTASRAKTGVGNEPDPIDVREKGERAD